MKHPFLQEKHLPDWSKMQAKHIVEDISEALKNAESSLLEITNLPINQGLSYKNTFEALDKALEPLNTAWGFVNHLDSVENNPNLRKAFNEMLPLVTKFFASIPLNPSLWKILQAYSTHDTVKELSSTKQRHIKETLTDFEEEGANLNDDMKETLRKVQEDLAELTQKYSENCLDATNAWELIIKDASELEGLPASAMQAAKESAKTKGLDAAWRLTLQTTSFIPVITYAKDAMLRKKVWEAYQSIGRTKPHENKDLVIKILKLRQQYATLLGKENFAEYTTNRRMAKSANAAVEFIQSMQVKIESSFVEEYQKLKTFKHASKNAHTSPSEENSLSAIGLEPWEIAFWSERKQREEFDFDEENLRPYFPIEQVIKGLFTISETLFGLRVEQVKAQFKAPFPEAGSKPPSLDHSKVKSDLPEIWNPEVGLYNLYDQASGALLGSFYTDWFPRASKRSGAWMNYLRTGHPDPDTGIMTPHLGLICGNLTPPLENSPALLTHHEVETIFHEFGHLLHHLCGSVEVPSLNGVNVAWDFVELPSQIMENWCWERASLDLFARHYKTGDPIPKELFDKMQASRNHLKALGTMRQLSLAKLDLDLHTDWSKQSEPDLDLYLKTRLLEYQMPLETESMPITYNFGHIFGSSTGYAAGYYSYKWAEVLDADAFTRFKEEGLLNPNIGIEFRDKVLSKGNSADPYELFHDFMGRSPSPEALLVRDGIRT